MPTTVRFSKHIIVILENLSPEDEREFLDAAREMHPPGFVDPEEKGKPGKRGK